MYGRHALSLNYGGVQLFSQAVGDAAGPVVESESRLGICKRLAWIVEAIRCNSLRPNLGFWDFPHLLPP